MFCMCGSWPGGRCCYCSGQRGLGLCPTRTSIRRRGAVAVAVVGQVAQPGPPATSNGGTRHTGAKLARLWFNSITLRALLLLLLLLKVEVVGEKTNVQPRQQEGQTKDVVSALLELQALSLPPGDVTASAHLSTRTSPSTIVATGMAMMARIFA